MNVITVNEAKRNFDRLIAQVVADAEPTAIATETGQQIVLLPLDEFNAWQETAYLLSNPANAAHLRQSIAQAQWGQTSMHELIEPCDWSLPNPRGKTMCGFRKKTASC